MSEIEFIGMSKKCTKIALLLNILRYKYRSFSHNANLQCLLSLDPICILQASILISYIYLMLDDTFVITLNNIY